MEEILKELQEINENIKRNNKDDLLSRKDVIKEYGLTPKGVAKIFNMKNSPIVKVGREQKISRKSLESIFQQGINL